MLNGLDYLLIRSPLMITIGVVQITYLRVNPFDIKKEIRWALAVRVIAGGLTVPLTFIGLKYLPASKMTLIVNCHPLLVAIFAFYLLKELLTRVDVCALIGSFIGVVLFSIENTKSKVDNISDSDYFFGIFVVILACIG